MRKSLLVAVFVVLGWISLPAHAQFCPGVTPWVFDDVPNTDPFCGFITEMAVRGVTLGCSVIDANHRLYCPTTSVRRDQMAAFMSRLADDLFPTTCVAGQVMKWNGSAWACANDNDTNSGGSVTSVSGGTGIVASPNPITGTGTLNLALGYQLPQGCASGQVAKSNGSGGWTCGADATGTGTVTSVTAGAGLTGGTITTTGTIAVDPTSSTLTGNFFKQGGNAFGATAVLGTTDNNAIDVRVNGSRVMRYEPDATSPKIVGGHPNNSAAGIGSIVSGGGQAGNACYEPTTGLFTRSCGNSATAGYATVAGGFTNIASGFYSAIGGGSTNTASGLLSTVAGGVENIASDQDSTVGGGSLNTASGLTSTIAGGAGNTASGQASTIAGGATNTASGQSSTIAGGALNIASGAYSFAGGYRAKTQTADGTPTIHDGAFVWADSNFFDFNTSAANEFAARATGGVRFVTAIDGSGNPTRTMRINPNAEVEFGNQTRQMLNLWGPAQYGIGVQTATLYFRSPGGFSWHQGGTHSNGPNDPGPGGTEVMRLEQDGTLYVTNGTVGTLSARAAKRDFAPIDAANVLDKLARMPISSWVYKANPGVRHLGPTAQDFRAAFGLGDDDERSIATVDADGVALAAIQGLNAKLEAKIAEQARELAELRGMLETLLAMRNGPEAALARR